MEPPYVLSRIRCRYSSVFYSGNLNCMFVANLNFDIKILKLKKKHKYWLKSILIIMHWRCAPLCSKLAPVRGGPAEIESNLKLVHPYIIPSM